MTAVNCPMCELRFATRTERDWHLRNEHRHHEHRHPPAVEGGGEPSDGTGSGAGPRARNQAPGGTR